MSEGYETAHIDDLESLPINQGEFVWRPVRRRFGITAFGANAYTGDTGSRVVEEHSERDGHQEMYVVLRGHATFTLGDDEVDAPAGTLVFVRPGTRRTAFAVEDGTAILAVGAKEGEIFTPSPWEDIFAGISYAENGDVERGRTIIRDAIAKLPDAWQGYYNAACLEARFGDHDEAIALLAQAIERGGDEAKDVAAKDTDFDSVRGRPDFPA